ncbi:MAG TPA: hypothetical protein VHI95_12485 [Acidimicrobiales bacterium]|nr:hypothetical protein [Acidimicrobiales bacterium]
MDAARRGRLVVLNGGSSSGKTAIARQLQIELGGTWLVLGVDLFFWTLPGRLFSDPAGIAVSKGVLTRGDEFMRLYAAFQHAIATLAVSGVDVLIDDVMLDGGADQQLWTAALGNLDVCWIGVRCAADIAEAREVARGDRLAGAARVQATSVHTDMRYDFEVDTGDLDAQGATDAVAAHLQKRWPDLGASAADAPFTYPLISAWTAGGSVRPAPWEERPSPQA